MKTSDFFYDLPQELIAQTPSERRDCSRLLCFNRATDSVQDKHFYDIIDFLQPTDVLVINNTKVLPARLFGTKLSSGGARIEVLLLKRLTLNAWKVLTRPAKRLKLGTKIDFTEGLLAEVTGEGEDGEKIIRFDYEGVFEEILDRIGQMPLPPYIHEKPLDPLRYQTVYAKEDGSSAAPTAGLHFTPELLKKIRTKGIEIVEVLLHVGLGTFRPVKIDNLNEHKMHSEYYEVSPLATEAINRAIDEGRRIVAVGTTSVRVLETASKLINGKAKLVAGTGETNIFIYPPYNFKVVSALITNFHLPESTLIMLISAFMGREKTLELYSHAINEKYRFFSFGDAMFIE